MSTQLELQAAELKHSELAQKGSILVTDTTAITGNFKIIQVLTDTVFSLLTSDIKKNGDSAAALAADLGTITAGTILCGKFTAVTLTSGKVILIK